MATEMEIMQTPLNDCHRRAGAKLVPFAGWEMPLQYEGIRQEHLAVRTAAGIFDVSHMGQIETSGPNAFNFLQSLLSNDLGKVSSWGAQYALLCREDGGVLDDLITYRLPIAEGEERFLTVMNAANTEQDLEWFSMHASGWDGVEVRDRSSEFAMIALQGPRALSILEKVWRAGDSESIGRFTAVETELCNGEVLICRTGYTGEDGVEVLSTPAAAADIWTSLVKAGAAPAGLGARDTLRLEACYPLYGNELTVKRTPIEAELNWCCELGKEFIGVEAMRAQAERGTGELLVAFTIEGDGIPRAGCDVIHQGRRAGEVTSGTFSPSLEVGIGMAYVKSELAQPDTEIEIDVRGKLRKAVIREKPLYRKGE